LAQHLATVDAVQASVPALSALLDPTPPPPLCAAVTTWVATLRGLRAMLRDLQGCGVVAVDLEAHSVYSYHGITCLVQVARRGRCWVIDAVALHDHMLLLRPLLEDRRVLKLMHSGGNDMQWLLRDWGLRCVTVLDTEQLALVRGGVGGCRDVCEAAQQPD